MGARQVALSREIRISTVLATAAVAVYLFMSLTYLDLPGLDFDESFFVNGALNQNHRRFLEWETKIGPWVVPVMLMRYIGAVKSYLYMPVFSLFGCDPVTARVPVIVLGLVTLLMTFLAVREMLGRATALLSLALLATDPSFIFSNRLDWGPVSIMLALKSTSLYLFWRWLNGGGPVPFVAGSFLLGLGFFDKINFIWYVGALGLAVPVCFWRQFRLRFTGAILAAGVFSFLLGCSPLLVYNIRHPLLTLRDQKVATTDWQAALRHRVSLIRRTLDGGVVRNFVSPVKSSAELVDVYRFEGRGGLDRIFTAVLSAFPLENSITARAFAMSLATIAVAGWWLFAGKRRFIAFFLLLFLLISGCIWATALATGTHHIMMLYPYPQILLAAVACAAGRRAKGMKSLMARLAIQGPVAICVAAVLCFSTVVGIGHLKTFHITGGKGRWSDAIYRLKDYLEKNPRRNYLLMDWGFFNQLLGLTGEKIFKREAYVPMLDAETESARIQSIYPYLINPENVFVFHAPPFESFPTMDLFRRSLSHYGAQAEFIRSFYQRDGQRIYQTCEILSPELDAYRALGGYFHFMEAEDLESGSGGEVDWRDLASMQKILGAKWGTRDTDFAEYSWKSERTLSDLRLKVRYATSSAFSIETDVDMDGRRRSTLQFHPTGGEGFKIEEWLVGSTRLGDVPAGVHTVRIHLLQPGPEIFLDFIYLNEGEFDLALPKPDLTRNLPFDAVFPNPEILGYQEDSGAVLSVNAKVIRAGVDQLSLTLSNFEAEAIDLLYSYNGKYMPILRNWKLNERRTASVFVGQETPRGLYCYRAIRDSASRSPDSWIRTNVAVLVK